MSRVVPSEQKVTQGGGSLVASMRRAQQDENAMRAMTMSGKTTRISNGVITFCIKRAEFTESTKYIDRMDPYVEVRPSWSHSVHKTLPDQDGHKTPTWKVQKHHSMMKIKFPGASFDAKLKINLQIFDKNRFTKDSLMGEGDINIIPLIRCLDPTSRPTEHMIPLSTNIVRTTPKIKSPRNNKDLDLSSSLEQSDTLQGGGNVIDKKITGKIFVEFHFQPHVAGAGGDEVQRVQSGGRGGMGALLGVVAETLHTLALDSNIRSSYWVILPSSSFRRKWDAITMLGLLYTAIFTPVQISFLGDAMNIRNIPDWWFVFCIDRSIDLIFLTDILVNFRSAWETDEGVETFHWKEAAWRYLTGWFLLDLVSAMPLDFLDLLVDPATSNGAQQPSQLRTLKLVRLFRLIKIAKVIRASRIFKRFEQEMNIKYALLRLFKFGGVILIVAHWNACK